MNLHVLRGPRIVPLSGSDRDVFADVVDENPLGASWSLPARASRRVVIWSGWLGDESDGRAPGVETWGRAGREAFEAVCDRTTGAAEERGVRVLVRPHARHVVSDIPSCADFLRRRAGASLGLLLDPASMLTGSMLAHGAEHIERILGALAPMAGVGAVLLANIAPESGGESPGLAPLTRGVLDAAALAAMSRTLIPAGLPVVLVDDDLEAQAVLLVRG